MPRLLCRILHTVLNSFAQLYVPACIAGVSYKSNKIFKKKQHSFWILAFSWYLQNCCRSEFTSSVCMICPIELHKNILQPHRFSSYFNQEYLQFISGYLQFEHTAFKIFLSLNWQRPILCTFVCN